MIVKLIPAPDGSGAAYLVLPPNLAPEWWKEGASVEIHIHSGDWGPWMEITSVEDPKEP